MKTKRLSLALLAIMTALAAPIAAQTQISRTVFTHTGSNQTFTVPAGANRVLVRVWGAGGAGGFLCNGGGGGFTEGYLDATPGQTFTIGVGGQGRYSSQNPSTYSTWDGGNGILMPFNGGGGTWVTGSGGQGGGYSIVTAPNGSRIVAGAGGGGGDANGGGGATHGGAGGTNGGASVHGAGGIAGGSPNGMVGGHGFQCGGGGGGWNGGGTGGAYSGGGGGTNGADGSWTVTVTQAGTGTSPGYSGDPDRSGYAGGGGSQSSGAHGVIVVYALSTNSAPTGSLTATGFVSANFGETKSAAATTGTTITFHSQAADSDGNYSRTRTWVNHNSTGWVLLRDDANPDYTWTYTVSAVGTYEFNSRALDSAGAESATAAINFTVVNLPTASLTKTVVSATYPGSVTLTPTFTNAASAVIEQTAPASSTISGSPTSGTGITLSNLAPGSYSWTLTTTNAAGDQANATVTQVITKAGQTVSLSPSTVSVTAGQSVTFTASGGQSSYNWSGSTSGSGSTKVVSFPAPGLYNVNVQAPADSNYDASNTATATVTVVAAPTATLNRTVVSGTYPGSVTLEWNTNVSNATISGPGFAGAQSVATPSGSTTLSSLTPGSYSWTLTTTNSIGATATATATAIIAKAGQTISLTPTATTIVTGQSVTFTASGGQSGYSWSGSASGSENPKVVSFPTAGTYTVSVQAPADSNYDASNTASATVTVVVSSGTIVFPASAPGDTSTKTVTIGNTGNSQLNATLSIDAGSTEFTTAASSVSSAPSGSSAVALTFAPEAMGTRTGILHIVTNDSANQVLHYLLQGEGSTAQPKAPIVALNRISGGGLIVPPGYYTYSGDTIALQAVVSDDDSDLSKIEWSIDGSAPLTVPLSGGAATPAITVDLNEGVNTVTASVFDAAGSVTTANFVITVSSPVFTVTVQSKAVPKPAMAGWLQESEVTTRSYTVAKIRGPI